MEIVTDLVIDRKCPQSVQEVVPKHRSVLNTQELSKFCQVWRNPTQVQVVSVMQSSIVPNSFLKLATCLRRVLGLLFVD
jgi:hypothetical protein